MSQRRPLTFEDSLASVDPEIKRLIEAEEHRQQGKIILIASESLCPSPVAEALASPYSAIYAEGYPSTRMSEWERERVNDRPRHLAFNRRYADRRYYKGCEYVNFVEVLAQKRAAELFAANGVRPDDLHVNVQPLSGSVANSAIYTAFLEPGDLIMGMALPHGGHLTHGSELNRSGKFYRVLPYLVDPETKRLDYDAIIDAAREHQPRMIIAGGSAYPWEIDWEALQRAVREVRRGCFLLADISHPAGLVAAGEYPSPVGYADVISLTTHKTLCGPRGAIIITSDRRRAQAVDMGVFPGEQGGPHINQIAAKAVAFEIAGTETFKTLMRRVKDNAATFAAELQELGVTIQGGGTESHLFLVDLKGSRKPSGIPLYGDICANLLDLCGIVVNKNTIPGDESAAHPTGIRIGTTLVSQQGYEADDMRALARLVHRIIDAARTFQVVTAGGWRGRARVEAEVLAEVRAAVRELTGRPLPDAPDPSTPVPAGSSALRVRGERAGVFLQGILSCNVLGLGPGERGEGLVLDSEGRVKARLMVLREDEEEPSFLLGCGREQVDGVEAWLRGLSDGYLFFDEDLTRKIDGPVAIERIQAPGSDDWEPAQVEGSPAAETILREQPDLADHSKPWFVGVTAVPHEGNPPALDEHVFRPETREELRRTPLHGLHLELTASRNMVPFAGYEMPVLYSSITEEHQATRRSAGLFDVSHMGTMDVRGPGATRFLDLLTTNFVWRLRPGQSHYTYVLRPDGSVMDDLLIYMRAVEDFMVVANAANAEEVLAWFRAVAGGAVRISNERPWVRPDASPEVRDLRDPAEAGDDRLVDLSLQGPLSLEILMRLAGDSPEAAERIHALQKSELTRVRAGGFDLIVSYTGYTGEEVGYEIFVHPDRAADLFGRLLELGSDLGVVPAGLGARDSLRCEAGFPLHGHELAGPHGILPLEAGYGAFVKEHKPFFVGREPHVRTARASKRRIARMRLEHTGVRMVQPGDPVAGPRGRVVGVVTSSALAGDHQIVLALVDEPSARPGTRLHVIRRPRRGGDQAFKPVTALTPGDPVMTGEDAIVLERFPSRDEADEACGTS